MPDLRQCLNRGVAALTGQPVLARHDQHMPRHIGFDQMMRKHGHRQPRGTTDLNGVGIGGPDAEMLGKDGGQHDVRRHRAVPTKNTVNIGSFQAGIGNRQPGSLAHEVKRRQALMPAKCCQPYAGDEAHDRDDSLAPLPLAVRGWWWTPGLIASSLPGLASELRSSRTSGKNERHTLMNNMLQIPNRILAGPAPSRR
jgi:hypothetical protein